MMTEERLKRAVVIKLIECGWRDQMKDVARDAIRKRGIAEITVDELSGLLLDNSALLPECAKRDILDDLGRRVIGTGFEAGEETNGGNPNTPEGEVEWLFSYILRTICVDIACAMHRMSKTRVLSLSSIMVTSDRRIEERKNKYPSFEKAGEELSTAYSQKKAKLEVDVKIERQSGGISDMNEDPRDSLARERECDKNQSSSACASSTHDIWGRVPKKEPPSTAHCTICGRNISALRFAPHLAKCLGEGHNRRVRPNI